MKQRRYTYLFWMVLLASVLIGCREQYQNLTFQTPEEFQTSDVLQMSEGLSSVNDNNTIITETPGPTEPMTSVDVVSTFPGTYYLLPANEREAVFDDLLGRDDDIYFIQEPGRETLVTFNDESNTPVRMAQACRIGNAKSSVLILTGLSNLLHEKPGIKAYTFEKGQAASVKSYTAGKDAFLKQFSNQQLMNRPKDIQGITGATPIWEPVAAQIKASYKLLLKDKDNPAWIAEVKEAGKVWCRRKPEIADLNLQTAEEPEKTVPSADQEITAATEISVTEAAVNKPVEVEPEPEPAPAPADSVVVEPEAFDFIQDNSLAAETDNDLLYEHWQIVATAEITLLACGLLVVTVAQIKRAIYK